MIRTDLNDYGIDHLHRKRLPKTDLPDESVLLTVLLSTPMSTGLPGDQTCEASCWQFNGMKQLRQTRQKLATTTAETNETEAGHYYSCYCCCSVFGFYWTSIVLLVFCLVTLREPRRCPQECVHSIQYAVDVKHLAPVEHFVFVICPAALRCRCTRYTGGEVPYCGRRTSHAYGVRPLLTFLFNVNECRAY